MMTIIHSLSYVIQFFVLYTLLFFVLKAGFKRSNVFIWKQLNELKRLPEPPSLLLKLLFINPKKLNVKHKHLYSIVALPLSYLSYLCWKRLIMLCTLFSIILLIVITQLIYIKYGGWYIALGCTLFLALIYDQLWLKLRAKYRTKSIVYDLYQLSYHLLYFADSQMNIYNKLQRCLPYTTAIKLDIQYLLLSWTQDSDGALLQFKTRLGCKEAISFVDTIQALKQHQDEAFYNLLRERIEEYKEQLNIANDSKNETFSYLLFILAGIPILYTFQVFIYPWVKEVQKLLLQLN